MIDRDRRFERKKEIEGMIGTALRKAGTQRPKVEKLRVEYLERQKAAHATLGHWKLDDPSGSKEAAGSSAAARDGELSGGPVGVRAGSERT